MFAGRTNEIVYRSCNVLDIRGRQNFRNERLNDARPVEPDRRGQTNRVGVVRDSPTSRKLRS